VTEERAKDESKMGVWIKLWPQAIDEPARKEIDLEVGHASVRLARVSGKTLTVHRRGVVSLDNREYNMHIHVI